MVKIYHCKSLFCLSTDDCSPLRKKAKILDFNTMLKKLMAKDKKRLGKKKKIYQDYWFCSGGIKWGSWCLTCNWEEEIHKEEGF